METTAPNRRNNKESVVLDRESERKMAAQCGTVREFTIAPPQL
jgi:hypothetical protein